MAETIARGRRPFGLADVAITPNGGALTDVPLAQELSYGIQQDSARQTGDDGIAGERYFNSRVEGSLKHGGIHPAIVGAMTGGVATTTGTAGTMKTVVAIKGASRAPYCKIEGKSQSDDTSTGDFHAVIWYARFSNPAWTQGEGAFLDTECDFIGVPDGSDNLIDFVFNNTAAAIA